MKRQKTNRITINSPSEEEEGGGCDEVKEYLRLKIAAMHESYPGQRKRLMELTEKPRKTFLYFEEWIRKTVTANSKSGSEIGTFVDEDANPV